MTALKVTVAELKQLVVEQLELVDSPTFDRVQGVATRLRVPLEQALVERARIPLPFLLEQLAQAWGVGFIDLKVNDVQPDALPAVQENFARANILIPFARTPEGVRVAMWDPRDQRALEEIRHMSRMRVIPHLAPESAIRRAQLLFKSDVRDMLARAAAQETQRIDKLVRPGDEAFIELMNRILEFAAVGRASDIHLEPYELECVVRYRIDGALQEVLSLSTNLFPPLVSRIKVVCGMRLDERRVPQDGRFEADLGGFKIDLRVSSLPTHWGEKIVMRVLSKENIVLDLEDLGLSAADFQILLRNVLRPYGMVLITGPTGSGKSTSLYAMLVRVGAERHNIVNISTVEDPVEYTLPRVTQTGVNVAAGVEFSTGLRALLRQDPDVIMVGEIRDRETAEIAIRCALVGRLLLSTLHTNDATGAVPRLIDMGVEPFLVASTLALVVAQRLVRRICVKCRESLEPDPVLLKALRIRSDFDETVHVLRRDGILSKSGDPLASVRLFRGKGCAACQGLGFRGRIGVFELFEVSDEIRSMIMERRDATVIRAAAVANGMKTMWQDGLAKAFLGETTLEEVFRVAL